MSDHLIGSQRNDLRYFGIPQPETDSMSIRKKTFGNRTADTATGTSDENASISQKDSDK